MASLRTPVGPLPSSIYWRRRAVALLVLAVVGALVFWALRGGPGAAPAGAEGDDANGEGRAQATLTPGPTDTSSHIDSRPGGRDEYEETAGAETSREPSHRPSDEPDGSGTPASGAERETGEAQDGGGGPPAAGLPDCAPGQVTLALGSARNEYSPDEEPRLRLTVRHDSGPACRVDVGHASLTLVLSASDDEVVFTTAHCPQGPAGSPLAVPAGGTATHTFDWDRRRSTEDCDAADGGDAPYDSYLVEARLDGFPVATTTFRLDED